MNINETFKQFKEEIIQSDDSKTAVDILLDKIEYLLCENDNKDKHIAELEAQLQRYQELQDDGRLVELPCKVGDIVYNILPTRDMISTLEVTSVKVWSGGLLFYWKLIDGIYGNVSGFEDDSIGKTVFFTEEEAQRALEDRK